MCAAQYDSLWPLVELTFRCENRVLPIKKDEKVLAEQGDLLEFLEMFPLFCGLFGPSMRTNTL